MKIYREESISVVSAGEEKKSEIEEEIPLETQQLWQICKHFLLHSSRHRGRLQMGDISDNNRQAVASSSWFYFSASKPAIPVLFLISSEFDRHRQVPSQSCPIVAFSRRTTTTKAAVDVE